uniref:Uncharacterized protein n=1 Tax=Anguilla anguilla TaxID=7936 RepID=A0A0E9W3G6_ANGAN
MWLAARSVFTGRLYSLFNSTCPPASFVDSSVKNEKK